MKPSNNHHHNIIQIHNNVMHDRQYSIEYSTILTEYVKYSVHIIMSIPHNTGMDLNNIMTYLKHQRPRRRHNQMMILEPPLPCQQWTIENLT